MNGSTSFWDLLLWSFWIFIWISAIIIWFRCVFDLFTDHTLSGWGKAGWAALLIFLPWMRFPIPGVLPGVVNSPGSMQLLALCPRINARLLFEPRPGHVHALQAGLAEVRTEFVATCDADTAYAADYLERAGAVFDANPAAAAVMAVYVDPAAPAWRATKTRWHKRIAATLLSRQCHTGGAGQTFRMSALRAAGSYDAARWPYVLKDHELAHRVAKHGDLILDPQLWCTPSDRRSDRTSVDWTLFERLAYHLTPFAAKDWLFYRFLAPRFAARAQTDLRLREHPWRDGDAPAAADDSRLHSA